MKASSHEKHSKQQWKKTKKNKKTKKVQTHGQGLGRGLAGDMGLNFLCFLFFWFFHGFLQFGQNLENTKKNKKKQKVQTHGQGLGYPHTNQKKTKNQKNQKTKKPKNQKTKKPKNQKNKKPKNQETEKPKKQKTKKNKKNKIAHPKGRGSDAECWVLSFWFFGFFGFFWFFCFLVFLFFGDVPSRDCQALSVVALEARSIHYSTAMFAMTKCIQPMNSREEWNSILSGCAICCWIFAQEMLQFAHSHSGMF